jgi:hypothetical protein
MEMTLSPGSAPLAWLHPDEHWSGDPEGAGDEQQ